MQLTTGNTLNGKAGSNSAITFTITGDRKASGVDSYEVLGQGVLTTSAAALLTTSPVAASTQLLIAVIELANTTASPVTGVTFYVNGTASTNQVNGGLTIPANGSAVYGKGIWQVYGSDGSLVTTVTMTLTGDVTGSGTSSIATTIANNVVSNAKIRQGAARTVIGVTGNATANVADIQGGTDQVLRVDSAGTTLAFGAIDLSKTAAAGGVLQAVSMPALTGDVTNSAGSLSTSIANSAVTNAKMANMADQTVKGNVSGGSAAPVDLTATQLTTIPNVATTSLKGLLAAVDKKKVDNLYYDVTANSIATLVGDDSTDNLSAWNTLFAALPVGATVFFPTGTFRFSGDIAITADKHLNIRGSGKYSSTIKTTSATANGFTISGGQYWYNTFSDLRFETTANKTAGAAILISTVGLSASSQQVGINIYRCSFSNWFKAIYCNGDNVGQGPGNLSVWESLDISIPGSTGSPNARGLHINGGGTNLVCSNSTINLGFPPFQVSGTACIEINMSGAIQFTNGEFIGGTNTLLLNANFGGTSSIAAVYATNCFFDQSAGSTIKITGANVTNRCKFVQCGITGGNVAGPTAVEIASTGTGAAGTATAAADGIDFFDCDIYPNSGSGTLNGFLITGAQGVNISACRISGWTNGIQATPAVSAGYTKIVVTACKMGATNNFTTPNTVGVLLNAGSFQYGIIEVSDNDFTGSTTPLTDNSTIGPTGFKNIGNNIGVSTTGSLPALASGGATLLAGNGRGAVTVSTTETFLATFRIPANGVQVGDIIEITAILQSSSTGTLIARARCGTAGTIAGDTIVNVPTAASAAGVANGTCIVKAYVYVVALGATATVFAAVQGTLAAAAFHSATADAPANVVTTAAWFVTFSATASIGTYTVRALRAKFI